MSSSAGVAKWSKLALAVAASGALLGPLLDNYHSQFRVLAYSHPKVLFDGVVVTDTWVPPMFALAGLIIGVGSVWVQTVVEKKHVVPQIKGPHVLTLVGAYSFQYYLSGLLSATTNLPSNAIFCIMCAYAAGLLAACPVDVRKALFLLAVATALGGPLIEWALLSSTTLYSYIEPDNSLLFPVWIVPVYFGGGPAAGLLACAFAQRLGILNTQDS